MQIRVCQTTWTSCYIILIERVKRIGGQILISRDVTVTCDTVTCTQLQVTNHILILHKVLVRDQPACCHRREVTPTVHSTEVRVTLRTIRSGEEVTLCIVVTSLYEERQALTRHNITAYSKRRRRVQCLYTVRHANTRSTYVLRLPDTEFLTQHRIKAVSTPLVTTLQDVGRTKRFTLTGTLAYISGLMVSIIRTRIYILRRQPMTCAERIGRCEMQPVGEMYTQLQHTCEIKVIWSRVVILSSMKCIPSLLAPPLLTVIRTLTAVHKYILVGHVTVLVICIRAVPRHLKVSIAQHRPTRRIVNRRLREVHLDIHDQPFGNVSLQRCVTAHFLHTCGLQCSLLIKIVKRNEIAHMLRTSVNCYVIVLDNTRMEELILPIPVLLQQRLRISKLKYSRWEELTMEIVELCRVHHFIVSKQSLLASGCSFQIHMNLITFLSGLGRYNDNTTCTLCTVNSGWTCILQYRDSLYIVRIKRATYYTIYYVDRSTTGINRTCTTNTDLSCITRLTTCIRNRQTGYLTLQHVSDITRSHICQSLTAYRYYGWRQLSTLNGRIAKRYYLLQLSSIRLHDDLHVLYCTQLNGLVADVRQLQHGFVRHLEFEITINVSHSTGAGALHKNADTNHRLCAICVDNLTFHVNLGKSRYCD